MKKIISIVFAVLVAGFISAFYAVSLVANARAEDAQPTKHLSIKGTCHFGKNENPWSAVLTPHADGKYHAVYKSTWNGKPLDYVGTITTDGKTQISGTGQACGGGANGTFEFSGQYGADGIAKCTYKEVGGRGRAGTMTAELPK